MNRDLIDIGETCPKPSDWTQFNSAVVALWWCVHSLCITD